LAFGKVNDMQMTMDQAMRPGFLALAIKRSKGYVMRSEKRPGYGGTSGGRGRKPKRPKAGIFYIIMTLIISVILWPVGMVMLWRKKVRMQAGTKLLISLLTMCMSVFLIVFALTVHVDNDRYTEFQDKANDWLNQTSAKLAVAGDAAYKQGVETWGVMKEFADDAFQPAMNTLADGLDRAVALACEVRAKVQGVPVDEVAPEAVANLAVHKEAGPAGRDEGAVSVRLPENTPDPDSAKSLTNGLLTDEGELKPGQTPEPTPSPMPTETPEPTEEALVWSAVEDGAPADELPLASAELAPVGDAEASEAPTAEPTPEVTPEPTELPEMTVRLKAPGEATVYYNETGRLYHMASTCNKMSGAGSHSLAEAVAAGKGSCPDCGTPDPAILRTENVVWLDENHVVHTSDECVKFEGKWTLISLNDAVAAGYECCPDCEAKLFAARKAQEAEEAEANATETPAVIVLPQGMKEADLAAPLAEAEVTAVATPEPTPEPAEAEPTPTPSPAAPTVVTPTVTLKPVGQVVVYHSSNGKFYHRREVCKGMTGSKPYLLSEITSKYRRCTTCDAPDTAMVGKTCLWLDEDGLCHTSDSCASFKGDYQFILRDDALEQGLKGCPDCGGNEYLVPNTTLG